MDGSRNSFPQVVRRSTRAAEASQKVFADGDESRYKRLCRRSLLAQTRIKATQKQKAKILDKAPDSVEEDTRQGLVSVNVSYQARRKTMERAKVLESGLDKSFVTSILVRLATGPFLYLPVRLHGYLPKQDGTITLVDDKGVQFPTFYHAQRRCLGNGWRKFSDEHGIVDGDALVFQLVKRTELQVYIVRAHSPCGDMENQSLHSCSGRTNQTKHVRETTIRETQKSATKQENIENEIEVIDLEEFQRRTSEKIVDFKDVKSFSSFIIAVGGKPIDSDLSVKTRFKYYNLCCSQNSFLHEKVGNMNLAIGAITEVVQIADAIEESTIVTFEDQIISWDNNLRGFEQLGMNVGFLRAQLEKLKSATGAAAVDSKKYEEVVVHQARVDEEIRSARDKLAKMEDLSKSLDAKKETLKASIRGHELNFQSMVHSSSW